MRGARPSGRLGSSADAARTAAGLARAGGRLRPRVGPHRYAGWVLCTTVCRWHL